MSLGERTLVVRNFDLCETSKSLLEELFANFGPVVNVVARENFAFIEFTTKESVAYAFALVNGVILNGKRLRVEPRVDDPFFYKYQDMLAKFEHKTHTEPSFVESFMDEEQKKERDTLHEELSRSNSKWSSVRRRLGRYEDHWDLDPVMNPILKMDFFKRRHHHQQPYEQRSHSSDNPNRRHGNDSHYRQYEAPHRSTSYSNLPHYDSYDHRPQYNHRYSHYDRYQDNYGYHRPPGNPGRRFQPPPPPPPPLQQHHHPYDERPPPPYRWH